MKQNLWFLTEERPKNAVVRQILGLFSREYKVEVKIERLRIEPILRDNKFTFIYQVLGVECDIINDIFLTIVSGGSSFVDYIIFYQDNKPTHSDTPIFIIEETKTDDSESRNTGVSQRSSKFVYADFYYPGVKKYMLYNLQIDQKEWATPSNIFGTRMLYNIGVEVLGKTLSQGIDIPFASIQELADFKNSMNPPGYGQKIEIFIHPTTIEISARLEKNGNLSHDPSIGQVSIIAATIRHLGWTGDIEIINHQLPSGFRLTGRNKFSYIANKLCVKLRGISNPTVLPLPHYFDYDLESEKNATIFLHLMIEYYSNCEIIFENHGGCEKGYYYTPKRPVAVAKYKDRIAYKAGDKSQIISLPDMIILDPNNVEIIDIEGKTFSNYNIGIEELKGFDAIDELYNNAYYPAYETIDRKVCLSGGIIDSIEELNNNDMFSGDNKISDYIAFVLTSEGKILCGEGSPDCVQYAVLKLFKKKD